MVSHEVDRITEVYQSYRKERKSATHWSENNLGNRLIERERRKELTSLLTDGGYLPLSDSRVLDIGCGDGHVLAGLEELGASRANLYGVDLLPDRVAEASRAHPGLEFRQANAEELPFSPATFDLVLAFTVFSSIFSDEMSHNIAREIVRVLRPGGTIVWYDLRFDNPFNPNVHGVRKHSIRRLFPQFTIQVKSITVLPPLARRLARHADRLYPVLSHLSLLRTHYLGLLRDEG